MAKTIKLTAAISAAVTVIFTILYFYLHTAVLLSLSITAGTIAYHFIMRLFVGAIVNAIMHNKADHTKKRYCLFPFEKKLYKKLKVKHWKKHLPTYDPSLFSVKEHTYDEIIGATCQAEVTHEVIAVLSFIPILFIPLFGSPLVFIITSVLSALFDMTFVIIQRYNRPRLVKYTDRQKKIEQRN